MPRNDPRKAGTTPPWSVGLKRRKARKPKPPKSFATLDIDGDSWGAADVPVVPKRPRPPAVDAEPDIALPPMPRGGAEREPGPPPDLMLRLGPPPESDAARASWSYRLATDAAWYAASRPGISDVERFKMVNQALATAAKHYPDAARFELAQKIDAANAELENRKRARAAARLERLPAAGEAKVIPIRGDG